MTDLLTPATKPEKRKAVTAADVRAALRAKLPATEYALLFEVRNAAGFGGNRSADAMALSLWPSRGLTLFGFEIKVFRSDWLRELKKPEKAEPIAKYCDRFVIVAPEGVVEPAEVPENWGLWELMGNGKWRATVEGKKIDAAPMDRSFLAAFLRRVAEANAVCIADGIAKDQATEHDRFEKRVSEEIERRSRYRDRLKQSVDEFEKASGVKIEGQWLLGDVGKAVKLVMERGIDDVVESVRRAHERIGKALTEFDRT